MQHLEFLARDVVRKWDSGGLAAAVRELSAFLDGIEADRVDYAEAILKAVHHCPDNVDVDDDPIVSAGEDGAWVSAWVFVDKSLFTDPAA
jgi:hypothetical protein